ncbi:synaptotagmin-5-like isoform X1 [Crassostrea angulata]|uniref:Synaptotagmin-C n=3 Tax=Magallana gigas TaxID=29159 RepID=K1R220_MAGGI|nr:synaptotagmin-5 isoform X1 [Crassostrea gigas]XP_052711562.1 synaptotagmin-5-like isoform X1 [Crassostrea angulata]XP_052711563.1 synaptotagmin-5-like isoform X1 [Crassostrea angulata]|eukprot:XP_011445375.1 PREDICTED: synaptotagmin-5 isoform X1 [Crassostrea gigas]
MTNAAIIGVTLSLAGVIGGFVCFILCKVYRKRKHRHNIPSYTGYDAVGDYKPPSLMSISTASQEAFLTKEHRSVQPSSLPSTSRGSISTMSRGSIKSDPFTEETSSISARSDTSADSLIFDPNFGAIRPDLYPRKDAVLQQSSVEQSQGKLHIRIKYDFRTSDVLVHLIEAQELVVDRSRDPEGGFGDPYIRISMIPEVDERIRQSSVKRRTHNPFYNEYFKFPVTLDEVKERTLIFQVFDYDKFSRHKTMGEVSVDLGQVDVTNSVEMWCDIQKQSQHNDMGELLLSLSYLPTAERLTVVVLKAKELVMTAAGGSCDPYVRISLVVDGKKVKRKKTSVKRSTTSPVWNEALTFNISSDLLPKCNLEVTVLDHDLIGHGEFVGRCIIGPNRPDAEGKHWNDMLNNHRKSMAMWQHLYRR